MKRIFINVIKEIFRPSGLLYSFRYCRLNLLYKRFNTKIGMRTSIVSSELGKNVFISYDCSLDKTKIGDHSYVNTNTRIKNAVIGRYCSIGSGVIIGIGKHPLNMVSTHPAFYCNNKAYETYADKNYYGNEYSNVVIENDVWVGSNSTIIGDVKIGNGAVIAYGSIVTKDVPPYAVVGGVPAKIIRYRFEKQIIDELQDIKWWLFPDDFLKTNFLLFLNPSDLLEYFRKSHE